MLFTFLVAMVIMDHDNDVVSLGSVIYHANLVIGLILHSAIVVDLPLTNL